MILRHRRFPAWVAAVAFVSLARGGVFAAPLNARVEETGPATLTTAGDNSTTDVLFADAGTTLTANRPASWAEPLDIPGVPNAHRVSAALYRGAQPTAEGFRELQKLGIKTVINLRSFHSDRNLLGDTGLEYVHLYAQAWHAESEDVVEFLKVVTDQSRAPVFVHCQHGADRTGTMCAVYRIVIEGWSKDEAIREMTQGGFGYHPVWKNLIRYIRRLDVESIQRKSTPPEAK